MHWKDRITRAEANVYFTDIDHALVRQWDTCAVGERVPAISDPYSAVSVGPAGVVLKNLGTMFYDAVCANDVPLASNIYQRIQNVDLTLSWCAHNDWWEGDELCKP